MTSQTFLPRQGVRCIAISLLRLFLLSLGAAAGIALVTPAARAVPYASGVTVNAGTVSFILNEAADNVTVVFDGGATMQDLGARSSGVQSFSLGAATTFEIVVRKAGVAPWTLISSDANTLVQFNSPRGVAVNLNPSSATFGRIYVANSAAGTTGTGRSLGDGIYVLNADQSDALGRGNVASTAGITFDATTAVGANSPWHLEVGEDSNLYISDFATNTSCIYYSDADVTAGGQVLAGIGWNKPTSQNTVHTTCGGSPIVRGSLAAGTLTVWCTDGRYNFPAGGSMNRLMRWDVMGGPLPYASAPTLLGNQLLNANADVTTDCDRAPDGKYFLMQNRSAGTESGLFVLGTDGTTVLWSSLATSRAISNNPTAVDILRVSRAVKVSPDNLRVALIRDDLMTWVLPVTNGIPDLGNRELVASYSGAPTTLGRDVCWDAAGNLYALSSGNALLRIFSPGGTTRTITRSDGTFTVVRPPAVSVVAVDAVASEAGPDTATFSISRPGDNTGAPLTVSFALTGTATPGVDYTTIPLTAIIPANETNVIVTVTPIDDAEAEAGESVVLTLISTAEYDLRPPLAAEVDIVDNEPAVLTVTSGRASIYEGQSPPLTFNIHRRGDTNSEAFLQYSLTGTATAGVDYLNLAEQLYLAPGVTNIQISVNPIDDAEYENDETVVYSLRSEFGDFIVGTPGSATGTIRDNEFPPACVLFSDDFELDSSAGWITRFGANNGLLDGGATWSLDYSTLGIPPAPHSAGGTTRGVRLAVNKDATASSAAVNIYPAGYSFHGNYALRADMLLSMGTANTTEHAQLGLNHSGTFTNRASQNVLDHPSTAGGDGVWTGIETDAGNFRDYAAYTYPTPGSLPTIVASATAASVAAAIPAPPYAFAGAPGNGTTTSPKTWANVELRQFNDVISLRVDHVLILSYTNTSGFTNGTVMLGMNDQFDSISSAGSYVIFDNVRVVSLDFLIKHVQLLPPDQIQIDFVSPLGGLAGDFHLQGGSDPGSVADDNGAVITSIPEGFRAVTTRVGDMRFYRIRR